MHNKTLLLYLLACLLLFTFGTYGEQKSQFTPIQGSYTSEAVETNYSIATSLGTHIVGIGVSSSFFYTTDVQAAGLNLGFIETGALLEFKHYRQYLGIPGDSQTGTMGLSVTYGIGPENSFPSTPYNHAGPARHNFSYRYNWYTSTDATNQSTGRLVYELAGNRNKLKLQMENDMLVFKIPIRDEYRTAALELEYLHAFPTTVGGVALGFMLWTGTTYGLEPEDGSKSLDLTGQYGGQYSHGIAFISFVWGIARLSIGYDSETIRDALQNTAHRIGNWYTIPKLERKDRWYFQLSLFSLDSLYR